MVILTLSQVSNPEDSELYKQFKKSEIVKDEALEVISNQVLPAFQMLCDYIHGKYYKECLRPNPGVDSIRNNGKEFYQAFLDYHNQVDDLYPNDIYEYGIEQLNKATTRFIELAAILGYGDDLSFSEAVEAVTKDPDAFFDSKEDTLQVNTNSVFIYYFQFL